MSSPRTNTPVKLSARQSLQISQLQLNQLELMGPDVDINSLLLQTRGIVPIELRSAVTDARITRSISGASSISIDVLDAHRSLLRSGNLGHKLDANIEGLWFRMKAVDKAGDALTLTLEDREIAVLRTYAKPIKSSHSTSRTKITRAEFILRLIKEPVEFKIPYSIPELRVKQPIGAATEGSNAALAEFNQLHRTTGIADKAGLTVKGQKITPTQLKVANTILDVGASKLVARPILVMAIMCAIQESTLTNLIGGDRDSVGVFQQRAQFGWPASRDVAKDAAAFYDKLISIYAADPNRQYWDMIQSVQRSGFPTAYAQWRTEADRIVNAYGVPNSNIYDANNSRVPAGGNSGDYEFYRGILPVQGQNSWLPENSWDCIQRLASEVNFRAFFVSGTFYYISEAALFESQPRMRITEGVGGVDYIDGNYDENKKVATASVVCRIGRWSAPPGAVVELYNMGPWDGRFLITDVERSLFNDQATITLEKPEPKLPEPINDSGNSASSLGQYTIPGSLSPGTTPPANEAQFGGVIPKDQIGSRSAVVQVALLAAAEEKQRHYHYHFGAPLVSSLWSNAAHGASTTSGGMDCSLFFQMVYKEAGAADPNGPAYNYKFRGSTGILVANGLWVTTPEPGDAVMYGVVRTAPAHVAVYIGNGKVVELGSDANGVIELDVNYRTDLLGYVSFLESDHIKQ